MAAVCFLSRVAFHDEEEANTELEYVSQERIPLYLFPLNEPLDIFRITLLLSKKANSRLVKQSCLVAIAK